MAVKDGERYLREAVDSILSQTFSDFEFIIVDDGSRDGTSQILDKYSDTRIVLLKNETSIGLTKSLNLGLEKAKGEYVARMDADDISLPHRLATQVSFLDANSQVGVMGTAAYLVDSDNISKQLVQYPEHHELLHWIMCFFENPILHPSVMFRLQVIQNLHGYNDAYVTSQDYNLWSCAVVNTKLANVEEICLHLRKHGENISKLKSEQQQLSSLAIGASLISRVLKANVKPAQLQSYCDFLWNGTQMPRHEVPFVANIIFRLSKVFLSNPQLTHSDRLWIVNNAIGRLDIIKQKVRLSFVMQMKLNYWVRSLKYLA
jgi:glycosyltransferase involved in cell wall biosynthesis